ncbi:MAG: M48 family metallopeptidase [Myxococcales bacterium]|nr:M48 family metallopeptidase [Myxococcales bacterium]
MPHYDFDFQGYIKRRKGEGEGEDRPGAAYAYPGDLKVLRTLGRVTPVTLSVEATVRLWKNVAKAELLGTAVKVSERQFPDIYQATRRCADKLQIPIPDVYVAPEVGTLNAQTFGTRDDSYIVLNGVLIDHLSPEELAFVIGHECGHIQNDHVVYTTALYYLMYSANLFVRWIVKPAVVALQSWSRRAEITCDRAGLICAGDLDVGVRALVKLALGSKKLADEVNIDEYLAQLAETQQSIGRVAEMFRSHPYLPKRAQALRYFARTHYYLDAISAERTAARAAGDASPRVGRSLNWCDAKCSRLISVFSRQQEEDDLDDGHGGAGGGNQSDDGSGRGEDGDGQTRN